MRHPTCSLAFLLEALGVAARHDKLNVKVYLDCESDAQVDATFEQLIQFCDDWCRRESCEPETREYTGHSWRYAEVRLGRTGIGISGPHHALTEVSP